MTRADSAAARRQRVRTTLLDLVAAIAESTEDDAQVVRDTLRALRAGRARPCPDAERGAAAPR